MAPSVSSAANLAIDERLLDEASELHIDAAEAAEAGIARAIIAKRRAREWAEENAEVIRSNNEYIEKYGLPLQRYRAR